VPRPTQGLEHTRPRPETGDGGMPSPRRRASRRASLRQKPPRGQGRSPVTARTAGRSDSSGSHGRGGVRPAGNRPRRAGTEPNRLRTVSRRSPRPAQPFL
jgi:hypothetical protein